MRKYITTAEVELIDIRRIKESSIVKYINSLDKIPKIATVQLPKDVEFWVWYTPNKTKIYNDVHILSYEIALDDVSNLKDIKDYYIRKVNAVYAFINIYLNKHPEIKKVDILQQFRLESLEKGVLRFGCKVSFG